MTGRLEGAMIKSGIEATRTKIYWNRSLNQSSKILCEFELRNLDGKDSIWIIKGGSTGHESFMVTDESVQDMAIKGWCACAGTPGRWDRLEISDLEMRRVFYAFKIMVRHI